MILFKRNVISIHPIDTSVTSSRFYLGFNTNALLSESVKAPKRAADDRSNIRCDSELHPITHIISTSNNTKQIDKEDNHHAKKKYKQHPAIVPDDKKQQLQLITRNVQFNNCNIPQAKRVMMVRPFTRETRKKIRFRFSIIEIMRLTKRELRSQILFLNLKKQNIANRKYRKSTSNSTMITIFPREDEQILEQEHVIFETAKCTYLEPHV